MRIVVISLLDSAGRRASAIDQLTGLGLEFEFFDAYDGSTPIRTHFTDFDRLAYRLNCQRDPLPGEIGCYASHLDLWKQCAETEEPLLILEDDFEALPGFVEAMPVLDALLVEHDFIRLEPYVRPRALGKRLRLAGQALGATGRFTLHYLSDVPTQLTAYAIAPSGAARLAEASRRLVAPADKFVQRTWDHGVPIFALGPAIVRTGPHSSRSTIGDRRALKSRKLGLLLARAAYKGVGELRRIGFDRSQRRRILQTGQ